MVLLTKRDLSYLAPFCFVNHYFGEVSQHDTPEVLRSDVITYLLQLLKFT